MGAARDSRRWPLWPALLCFGLLCALPGGGLRAQVVAQGGEAGQHGLPETLPNDGPLGFSTGRPVGGGAPPVAAVVLTLNEERLFSGSLWGRRAQAEFDAGAAALTSENRKLESDLAAEEKQLTDARAQMDPQAFRATADAFDNKVVGIRAAQDAKARTLNRDRESERRAFFSAVLPVLSEVMRSRGAVAILDSRAILLAENQVDVTAEAVVLADQRLGDGSDFEPPGDGDGDAAGGDDAGGADASPETVPGTVPAAPPAAPATTP